MARAMLLFHIVLVLLQVHETWSAQEESTYTQQYCAPSSCGDIHHISYPFALEGDPENCGDPKYKLSCENNQTVLYLYAGKYNVRVINYSNFTIRVSDSGIQENDNFSFMPHNFLGYENFSSGDPYVTQVIYNSSDGLQYADNSTLDASNIPVTALSLPAVFVSCQKAPDSYLLNENGSSIDSIYYANISACFNNGLYSSNSPSPYNSKRYRYVVLSTSTADVKDSCQLEQMSLMRTMPWTPYKHTEDISCRGVHDDMAYGFELSWYNVYCGSCAGRHDICYVDDANHNIVHCYTLNHGKGGFIGILYQFIGILYQGFRGLVIELFLGVYHAAILAFVGPCLIAYLIYKWRRRHLSMYDTVEEFLQSHNNIMPIRYSYSEIKKITMNFKDKLGEGGYGTVFEGTLRSDCHVAIKMLSKSKANGQEFINEVATIGRIHHVNVVQLIGYCVEGSKRALVYEFMPRGSLNNYIFLQEGNILLSYERMYVIALGVARGIQYLHQGCDMQILHFDIKPHNILLDKNFTPKISDFGLAKLYPVDQSIVSLDAARGTFGYMAPELFYKNIGGISYKADVYSFGMLLMEMAGRRKNLNAFADHSSQIYFPTWAYDQLHDGKDIQIENATEDEKRVVKKITIVALWCIQLKPSDRPSMHKVVEMLEGEVEYLQMPPKPSLSPPERHITVVVGNSNQTCSSSQSDNSSE